MAERRSVVADVVHRHAAARTDDGLLVIPSMFFDARSAKHRMSTAAEDAKTRSVHAHQALA